MGIVKDIIDTGKEIFRNISNADDKINKVNKKSFARGANDQTFQFPCIISDSIPIDMASTITRIWIVSMHHLFRFIYQQMV